MAKTLHKLSRRSKTLVKGVTYNTLWYQWFNGETKQTSGIGKTRVWSGDIRHKPKNFMEQKEFGYDDLGIFRAVEKANNRIIRKRKRQARKSFKTI